jgi:hypothetical protein
MRKSEKRTRGEIPKNGAGEPSQTIESAYTCRRLPGRRAAGLSEGGRAEIVQKNRRLPIP